MIAIIKPTHTHLAPTNLKAPGRPKKARYSALFLSVLWALLGLLVWSTPVAKAEDFVESHGFALHGDLKYPKGFPHFDFVNALAPKGGTLKLMGFGTYDSLNPYTLKGTSPFNTPGQFMYGFSELNETLLAGTGSYSPSGDEPQSAYGLLAQSLRYPKDYRWVEFSIRPDAAFHDGHPVDAHDVVYSYNTLLKDGHPRFQQSLLNVSTVVAASAKTVRVTFKQAGQGASILRFGEMPILPQHYWQDKEFASSSQIPPLLSGPYRIEKFDIGNSIRLERVPNFWGASLNLYQGRYNFDNVDIQYYRDQTIAFEAFKAGEFDLYYDYTAKNWAKGYDFPALRDGRVLKRTIEHEIPSGTQGFFFNTRRALFNDPKVREAISLMFDFEWTNANLFNDAYKRNHTYYPNSDFSAGASISEAESALLEPHRKHLPAALFDGPFVASTTKGNGNLRPQIRRALALLDEAGWSMSQQRLVNTDTNKPFEFEILLRQAGLQRIILPFTKNLEKIGIKATVRLVDSTQYKVRIDNFDFDMMTYVLSQGKAPSFEQRDYFHSATANQIGSQNYASVNLPVVDTLLESVLAATSRDELRSAMKALDRVLLWHHYIIPNWHVGHHRLAQWDKFEYPSSQPKYTLGVENWWAPKPAKTKPSKK